jgi:hypothetical protein
MGSIPNWYFPYISVRGINPVFYFVKLLDPGVHTSRIFRISVHAKTHWYKLVRLAAAFLTTPKQYRFYSIEKAEQRTVWTRLQAWGGLTRDRAAFRASNQ